jgi:serine protease Do
MLLISSLLLPRKSTRFCFGSCLIALAMAGPGLAAAPPKTKPVAANKPAAEAASAPSKSSEPNAVAPAPITGTGQRIYERTRPLLLQVRTLLKTQDSQSSVGSGFLVDDGSLIVTNFHVISQYALQPSRYRLVYASVDGKQGALQLLAFDVVHDLALLKAVDAAPLASRGAVPLRPEASVLPRGARIFSLGNPLDVGFAVAEGNYNGQVERSFLPTLFFGGSLSPGMSGGPALDEQGRLVGVNVAARRDGEQVSFLVPAASVRALIAKGRNAPAITTPSWAEITRQLLVHQSELTARFVALPWRNAGHARYAIPVPQEEFMRCWGRGSPQAVRGLQFERSDCEMDSRIFVNGNLLTGYLVARHEAYDGAKLGALRFAERYSSSFRNEFMGADNRNLTAPQCAERQVKKDNHATLPLKAVICLRAYKKLDGLHDVTVLVATLDGAKLGVQGRFEARGVSLASAQRLAQHYIDGYDLVPAVTKTEGASKAASGPSP